MSEDEWVDHIIVQALANMLCVKIVVLCTIHENICNGSPLETVNIGLIGELHYVALETDSHTEDSTQSESQTSSAQALLGKNTDEQEEFSLMCQMTRRLPVNRLKSRVYHLKVDSIKKR